MQFPQTSDSDQGVDKGGRIFMGVPEIGAICFGIIVGWVTYRTLRRSGETIALSNIATVIGAVA